MADLDLVVAFLNTTDKRTFRRHGEPHVAGEQLTSPQALAEWLTTAFNAPPPEATTPPRDPGTATASTTTPPRDPGAVAASTTTPSRDTGAAAGSATTPSRDTGAATTLPNDTFATASHPSGTAIAPRRGATAAPHPGSAAEGLLTDDLTATIALRTALRAALDGDVAALPDYPVRLVSGPPDNSLRLAATTGRPWLDEIVETVAASVARGDWKRVKLCDAPDCRWAFHDTSRNGRGRWCEMGVCGNRHKTRAYRERRQQHPV